MYTGAYYSVLVVDDDGGSVVFFSLYEFQKAGKSTRGAGQPAGTVVDRTIL